ncbi:LysR family transcriptional regulator (plasmid) [Aliisedimentitalea scapharcae]|uniref:LysR family transcriptional regulator n=1 Tax=Aliisedimentitalea scapharcae TaxID=1524259 RepID=A0ABZ2XYF7_9RHOB
MTWLHGFEATARLGSMTLAATEIGVTQATLSQQIKALEARLGRQLFVREPRGVSLTASGTRLYSDIAPSLDQIGSVLSRYHSPQTKRLRILCNTSLATGWLTSKLPEFHRQHPEVVLELRTALWRPDRYGYEADIEIFLGAASPPARTKLLAHCPIVAVAAPSQAAVQPASDKELPIIRISGLENLFMSWSADQKANNIRAIDHAETDSVHSAISLAEAGLGWTLCPSFLVREAVKEGRLVEHTLAGPQYDRAYWLQINDAPSAAAHSFSSWVRNEAHKSSK